MIKLTTDCAKCIHAAMCKHYNNAKNAMEKLKNMTYGDGPNDDYDWATMMDVYHVNISFSCPDFRPEVAIRSGMNSGRDFYNVKKNRKENANEN